MRCRDLLRLTLLAALPAAAQIATQPARPASQASPAAPRATTPSLSTSHDPLLGSVPNGTASVTPIDLTLEDALARGLNYNLALVEGGEDVRLRRAERLRALSQLLPTASIRPSVTEQQVNLAAFGFSGLPGVPSIVGPFTVYDARAYATVPVWNTRNLGNYRASREEAAAAEYSARDVREQISLVVTGLYLQGVAAGSRVETQRSQVETADASYKQAVDRKNAGTVPGIDVLRAQVELQSEQQQLIYYEGEAEKLRLNLGRAIGMPAGQAIRLVDTVPYTALSPTVTLEATLEQALKQRLDYQAQESLVHAAELAKSAALARRLPSASVDANYGVIGQRVTETHGSFAVVASVEIPIFQGGKIRADVEQADALLRRRRAELEDMRGRIDAEVRLAFIDIRSSARQVEVAQLGVTLAAQQLQQARDRFAAGVTNNLEVVQAQQALAQANQNQIAALYAFNVAKARMVRARGDAEKSIKEYLRRVP